MDDKDFMYRLFGFKQFMKVMKETQTANNIQMKKDKATSENARKAGNDLYAQKNHDKKIHNNILMEYTKSIAYALQESEELALGFGNRSALLFHLQHYEDCIMDIDRALKITKSDQLKSKLQTRKGKCLSLINDNKPSEKSKVQNTEADRLLALPNMTSQKIPCAADSVKIESNKMYTKQMTATRDIKPGEIVIVEKAYACSVTITEMYLVCSHCLSVAWAGIPCDSCVFSIYCSENCKKEAWAEYHDNECAILPSLYSFFYVHRSMDPTIVNQHLGTRELMLLLRVFVKAIKNEGLESMMNQAELIDNGLDLYSNGVFHCNEFGYVYSMRGRPQNPVSSFNGCVREAAILYAIIKRTDLIPVAKKLKNFNADDEKLLLRLRDILINLKHVVANNIFCFSWNKCSHENFGDCQCTECETFRGGLCMPCSAIFNHSCVPNLSRFYLPEPKMIIYASRPIKKGEQLFISYGPMFYEEFTETKSFLNSINYTCKCLACKDHRSFLTVNPEPMDSKYKKIRSDYKKICKDNSFNVFSDDNRPFKWTEFTQASVEQTFKLIELHYKHFQFNEACIHTIPLNFYLKKAFQELYGGKCEMLSHC